MSSCTAVTLMISPQPPASVRSWAGVVNRMSSVPKISSALSNMTATWSSSLTSHCTTQRRTSRHHPAASRPPRSWLSPARHRWAGTRSGASPARKRRGRLPEGAGVGARPGRSGSSMPHGHILPLRGAATVPLCGKRVTDDPDRRGQEHEVLGEELTDLGWRAAGSRHSADAGGGEQERQGDPKQHGRERTAGGGQSRQHGGAARWPPQPGSRRLHHGAAPRRPASLQK